MGQTVVEKIAERHRVDAGERPLTRGDFPSLRPRHLLTHDNSSAVIGKFRALGRTSVADASQPVIVLDHDIQNRAPEHLARYAEIERFAAEQGIDFYPAGSGIGHQVMLERLYAVPGALVLACDSHANMYGAIGALGTPIVRTDAAAIWARGSFWWRIPRTVEVRLEGALGGGATGKDVILALCARFCSGEVLNAAIEFAGPGVETLSMDDRMTIANMTTEWGALSGWFPVDATTRAFIAERRLRVERDDLGDPEIAPDPDARYAARITLDLDSVSPHVAGPDTVHRADPLGVVEAREVPIDRAYLLSCVNSRVDDLAAAARVLRGRRVAPGVELYVAAASREVQATAEARGDWQVLLDAGATPLPSGCGPCIGLGVGLLQPGEVGISATNRNFRGRMGSREARCYLASPAVVAASAAAGTIRGPHEAARSELPVASFEELDGETIAARDAEPLPGFPRSIEGRLVRVPADNLDTDGICGKEWIYRGKVEAADLARVAFANYDPGLSAELRAGDVILAGRNFGCGSSREQAVTALAHRGVALVVAASFSRTYLRNAFNNGFLGLACPAFAEAALGGFDETVRFDAGGRVRIDFVASRIEWEGRSFAFTRPGEVVQQLVVDGGLEAQLRRGA